METQISGQGFEVTKPIEQHIHQKLKKIQKHFNRVETLHIVLKIEKNSHLAEATVHSSHHNFFVHAKSDDMYITVDMLIAKLDRQIIKHKEKLKDHHSQEVVHHTLKTKR
ncbi:MAG: ribosome-associated translation inhibitor RaiA [Chromatiales bacterium]|nr:ribosome-associated translation inhibitor RaiA [Chromatiales bacterium]